MTHCQGEIQQNCVSLGISVSQSLGDVALGCCFLMCWVCLLCARGVWVVEGNCG